MPGEWASRCRRPALGATRLAALAGLLLGLAATPALARSAVRGLSLEAAPTAAALTVDLSRVAPYRVFTLSHPHRIVIDIRHAGIIRGVRLPRARGVVDAIRDGRRPDGGLRLVLQLRSALPVHAHWSASRGGSSSRLVVLIGAASALDRAVRSRVAQVPSRSGRDIVIAVDPGHGGQDPGAIGPGGLEEKTVTLAIGRDLAGRIDAQQGMRAVLTRNRDMFLPLRERLRLARAAKADLFVSIHADSVHDQSVSGSSVYILSLHGATDEAARWLAERENAADLLGGVSLADKSNRLASVLLDLSQSASISASMKAADSVLASLERVVPVCKTRVQQAAFVVLKSPDIPSMLVETAYISDLADERRLRNPRGQRRIADAIFRGLRHYFEQHPPTGTLFALEHGRGAGAVLTGAAGGPPTEIPR
jgi:N-acetylmuramoyl-L-alanine amidase